MSIDLAQRVHNHNYRLDPFVRSLLDTDFYKLLMAAFIWKWYPDVDVKFSVKNRSARKGRLRDVISEEDLRAQLDFARGLTFTNTELIWLQGNSFYGQTGIFEPAFIQALRSLRLPPYKLETGPDGDYALEFSGSWLEVTFWEIIVLAIVNEARARAAMSGMSGYQLRVLYANATARLVGKLKVLKNAGVTGIAEFGTRRRHGFLWQDFAIEAMQEELGSNFIGTSNALQAMRNGIEAIGTNAHELPMVVAAIARLKSRGSEDPDAGPVALRRSQFEVLEKWQQTFGGNLLVALPDTFGTTQFLQGAGLVFPDIRHWTGFREDSKDPFVGANEKINFWRHQGVDPREKLQLFSDGLDVEVMVSLFQAFKDRTRCGFGWGTLVSNDFRACDPRGGTALDPISIVCKVSEVTVPGLGSVSAVKLSDNYEKATGEASEVAYYREVFGTAGVANAPVIV